VFLFIKVRDILPNLYLLKYIFLGTQLILNSGAISVSYFKLPDYLFGLSTMAYFILVAVPAYKILPDIDNYLAG